MDFIKQYTTSAYSTVTSYPYVQKAKEHQPGWKTVVGASVGTAVGAIALPYVVVYAASYVGFTSAGIAAKSWAAYWMSSAAIANGGGVAAGSLVASLQAVGATTAVGAATTAATTVVGATAGAVVAKGSPSYWASCKRYCGW